MGDKFDGILAGGGRSRNDADLSVSEALQSLALHETLVTEDEDGGIILFRAVQDTSYGGILVLAERDSINSEAMNNAIKLSQMTSMLNDKDRCFKYAKAISAALQRHPNSSVLDIGTGTGLLACLAAKAGARTTYAVEMFKPMADLACAVIKDNKLEDRVTVYAAKSTELSAQKDSHTVNDLPEKADILVTEIFDSALLGEACLPVIQHARDNLLKEGAHVIPGKATLYGVVIQSKLCAKFRSLGSSPPFYQDSNASACHAGSIGIPLHFQALLEQEDFEYLTDEFVAFEFDFSVRHIPQHSEFPQSKTITRIRSGVANAVLTWWELDLTGSGDIVYSTKPLRENWQDHWLPVVYPIAAPAHIEESSLAGAIPLSMGHNEISFWFSYGADIKSPTPCLSGFYALPGGPYRIAELCDEARNESLRHRVEKAVTAACKSVVANTDEAKVIRCIDVSDSSICAVLASQVKSDIAIDILSVEGSEESALLYQQVARRQVCNKLVNVHIEHDSLSGVLQREQIAGSKKFNVLLSEPYTRAMQSYPLSTLANLIIQRNALSDCLAPDCTMVPNAAQIKAQAILFAPNTLQNSFGAVTEVQGLDHKAFAQLYESWPGEQRISLPMFQYETQDVSEPAVLKSLDLRVFNPEDILNGSTVHMKLTTICMPDAIKLWVEYDEEPPIHVARYEIALLDDITKQKARTKRSLIAACSFNTETGSFDVNFTIENP